MHTPYTAPSFTSMLRSPWFWGPPALMLLVIAVLAPVPPPDAMASVQRLTQTAPDWLWWWLTWLGDTHFALALFLAAANATAHHRASPSLLWSIAPTTLTLHGIKALAAAPRPAAVLPHDALHIIGEVLRQGSFPSGHAATASTLAACWVLTARPPKRWMAAAVSLPLAFAIGLSRVAVGAHWPLDVAVGALLGWLCAAAAVVAAERWGPCPGDRLYRWQIGVAGVLGLGLWWRSLPANVEPLAHALGGLVVGVALVAAAQHIGPRRSSTRVLLRQRREAE